MKIFVIGGHKNGTESIHQWFIKRGLKSCHGKRWYQNQDIIEKYDCFLDHFGEFNYAPLHNTPNRPTKDCIHAIQELDDRYPNSLFILNYRDLSGYINSLLRHLLWGNIIIKKKNIRRWSWNFPEVPFSKRIINTHYTNEYAINYFNKTENKGKMLVINVCNGENENNTKILENFIGLKHKPDILLEKYSHGLPSFEDNEMKKEYENKKNKIEKETNKIYNTINETIYTSKLDLAYKLDKETYLNKSPRSGGKSEC